MADRQTVVVYVRKGANEDERTLSFKPPNEVTKRQLLEQGFAIDGHSAIAGVTRVTFAALQTPSGTNFGAGSEECNVIATNSRRAAELGWTLADALRDVEMMLVHRFDDLGYDVEFA